MNKNVFHKLQQIKRSLDEMSDAVGRVRDAEISDACKISNVLSEWRMLSQRVLQHIHGICIELNDRDQLADHTKTYYREDVTDVKVSNELRWTVADDSTEALNEGEL